MCSITIQLSDLELAEMIEDELQTLTLGGFDPHPGRYSLACSDFLAKRQKPEDTTANMLANAPVRMGVKK